MLNGTLAIVWLNTCKGLKSGFVNTLKTKDHLHKRLNANLCGGTSLWIHCVVTKRLNRGQRKVYLRAHLQQVYFEKFIPAFECWSFLRFCFFPSASCRGDQCQSKPTVDQRTPSRCLKMWDSVLTLLKCCLVCWKWEHWTLMSLGWQNDRLPTSSRATCEVLVYTFGWTFVGIWTQTECK